MTPGPRDLRPDLLERMRAWAARFALDVRNDDVGPDEPYSDAAIYEAIEAEYPGGAGGFVRTGGRPSNLDLVRHALKYLGKARWERTGHKGVEVRRARIYVKDVSWGALNAAVGMVIPATAAAQRDLTLEEAPPGVFSLYEPRERGRR